jgi:hypothetical protein
MKNAVVKYAAHIKIKSILFKKQLKFLCFLRIRLLL